MTTSFVEALTKELDSYTPCILEKGNVEQRSINRRLLFLVSTIISVGEKHFSKPQSKKLIFALRYTARKHEGVYRKDKKTPYLLHPLEVTVILIELGIFDFKIIIAAILHDIPEDTKTLPKEIAGHFGHAVKNIVGLVTVPEDSIPKQNYISFVRKSAMMFFGKNGEDAVETMVVKPLAIQKRKLYYTVMKQDPDLNCRWRAIVLKFADRKHNIITLGVMSEEKRMDKIKETKEEFPDLYVVLEKTMTRLYERGTIKNKKMLAIPKILKNALEKEMAKHS